MSATSPSADRSPLPRVLRVAGALALLLVQGSCGLVAQSLYRLTARATPPSRAAQREAAIEAARAKVGIAFPSVMGYVDHVADDGLAVMTPEALVGVRLDDLTVFRTPDGLASAADVRPGSGVVVTGSQQPDGRVLADVVLVRPAP